MSEAAGGDPAHGGAGEDSVKPDKQKNGTPGNNKAQNEQVDAVVNKLKLTKDQRRSLHDIISGENMGYKEILEIAKEVKGGFR